MMSKLKLGPIADDKPLKVQVELPAALHGTLLTTPTYWAESKVSPLLTQLG